MHRRSGVVTVAWPVVGVDLVDLINRREVQFPGRTYWYSTYILLYRNKSSLLPTGRYLPFSGYLAQYPAHFV